MWTVLWDSCSSLGTKLTQGGRRRVWGESKNLEVMGGKADSHPPTRMVFKSQASFPLLTYVDREVNRFIMSLVPGGV